MNRIWVSAIAIALLTLAGSVQAGGRPSHSAHTNHGNVHPKPYHNYYLNYGKRFQHGYFYSGRNHNHWSYRYWDKRYRSYLHWDSSLRCYYYWCAPRSCYYPINYCPYNTYCWDQPDSGLEAPVANVPTVMTSALEVNGNGGIAPPPNDLPPPTPPTTPGILRTR